MALAYGYDQDGDVNAGGWAFYQDTPRFRYGYQIGDAKPRLLGSAKTREDAELEAKSKATDIRRELETLSAPTDVSWWVQNGQTTTRTEWDDPNIEAI